MRRDSSAAPRRISTVRRTSMRVSQMAFPVSRVICSASSSTRSADEVGGAVEDLGAAERRQRRDLGAGGVGGRERALDDGLVAQRDAPDLAPVVRERDGELVPRQQPVAGQDQRPDAPGGRGCVERGGFLRGQGAPSRHRVRRHPTTQGVGGSTAAAAASAAGVGEMDSPRMMRAQVAVSLPPAVPLREADLLLGRLEHAVVVEVLLHDQHQRRAAGADPLGSPSLGRCATTTSSRSTTSVSMRPWMRFATMSW